MTLDLMAGHRGGLPHGGLGGAGHAPRHLALEPPGPAVAEMQTRGRWRRWDGETMVEVMFYIDLHDLPSGKLTDPENI